MSSLQCDSTSAISIAKNPVLHSKTKHVEVRYHFLRENVEKGNIALIHVPTYSFGEQLSLVCGGGAWCVFDFLSWVCGSSHKYSFLLCISCIWHGICNMMFRHPCI
jgi:hypothetical protein